MKKWLRLGIILSVIIIAIRYLLSYIVDKLYCPDIPGIACMWTFPPQTMFTLYTSIAAGFLIAFLISLFSRKRRR